MLNRSRKQSLRKKTPSSRAASKGDLCCPQVEELLRRLRGVLPDAPLVGGITQPAAWSQGASLRGAVFLNSDTHDQGAVGCLLRGPLRFDQLILQVRLDQPPARACTGAHWVSCPLPPLPPCIIHLSLSHAQLC